MTTTVIQRSVTDEWSVSRHRWLVPHIVGYPAHRRRNRLPTRPRYEVLQALPPPLTRTSTIRFGWPRAPAPGIMAGHLRLWSAWPRKYQTKARLKIRAVKAIARGRRKSIPPWLQIFPPRHWCPRHDPGNGDNTPALPCRPVMKSLLGRCGDTRPPSFGRQPNRLGKWPIHGIDPRPGDLSPRRSFPPYATLATKPGSTWETIRIRHNGAEDQ